MYADFFGFRELPFNNTPDPRFFYSTPDHEEALASLIYAVSQRKGFVLLTGEIGAGKTLVTRLLVRHFATNIAFANLSHAIQNADDLLASICHEFDLPVRDDMGPAEMVRTLHDFLLAQFAQNLPVVLVLDEAQSLPDEGFERLRMIGNLEADDAKLLQIAIVGQPELRRRFKSPGMRQLRQRIFRTFHLAALDRANTEGYIRHRLGVVTDHGAEIFTDGAFDAIHQLSQGLPRVINTLCDNALLSAYSSGQRRIDEAFIGTVSAQMMADDEEPSSAGSTPTPGAPRTIRLPARPAGTPHGASRGPEVERSVGAVSDTLRQSRAAQRELQALLQLTNHARQRTVTASQTLERREERLAALAATLSSVIRELKPLLSNAGETVAACRQSEVDARTMHERLLAQVREGRRLLGELTRGPARAAPRGSNAVGPDVLKHRSVPTEQVAMGPERDPVVQAEQTEADNRLRQVRESLSDLRALAHRPSPPATARCAADTDQPTSRLLAQVDHLLDSLQPRDPAAALS